jgi:hypothetical protein
MNKFTKAITVVGLSACVFLTSSNLLALAASDGLVSFYDFSLANTNKIFADYKGTDSNALEKIPTVQIKNIDGESVYSALGRKAILSSDFMPINTANKYALSGRFKSVGTASPILYYGVATFDENKRHITAMDVNRNGSDATITAYTDTGITVAETLNGWNQSPTLAYKKSIGFYYDGNTTKLPDYVWLNNGANASSTETTLGTYSTATGNTIALNVPIPAAVKAKIVLGKTVIKNHTSGGAYVYFVASNAKLTSSWVDYSAEITGESFDQTIKAFRPGTKFVKILILANYLDLAGQETAFDNILFKELSTGRTLVDQTNNNNGGTVYGNLAFEVGKDGSGGNFDGIDDYIDVPNSPQLTDLAQNFTWSFWINNSSQTAGEGRIIDYGNTSIVTGTLTGQKIKAWIKTDSESNAILSDKSIDDKTWHHVALTWDGTTIKMYIDGNQQMATITKSGTLSPESKMTIGGESTGNYYAGLLDEVKIFNYALSADEIKILSGKTIEVFWSLVAEYIFHQGNVHVGGNLKLDGDIISDGDICIGECL